MPNLVPVERIQQMNPQLQTLIWLAMKNQPPIHTVNINAMKHSSTINGHLFQMVSLAFHLDLLH